MRSQRLSFPNQNDWLYAIAVRARFTGNPISPPCVRCHFFSRCSWVFNAGLFNPLKNSIEFIQRVIVNDQFAFFGAFAFCGAWLNGNPRADAG